MTSDRSDNTPAEQSENGMLSDTGGIDTTGLGLLGTNTVNVTLPSLIDDGDDDVVDDEGDMSIMFDSLLTGEAVEADEEAASILEPVAAAAVSAQILERDAVADDAGVDVPATAEPVVADEVEAVEPVAEAPSVEERTPEVSEPAFVDVVEAELVEETADELVVEPEIVVAAAEDEAAVADEPAEVAATDSAQDAPASDSSVDAAPVVESEAAPAQKKRAPRKATSKVSAAKVATARAKAELAQAVANPTPVVEEPVAVVEPAVVAEPMGTEESTAVADPVVETPTASEPVAEEAVVVEPVAEPTVDELPAVPEFAEPVTAEPETESVVHEPVAEASVPAQQNERAWLADEPGDETVAIDMITDIPETTEPSQGVAATAIDVPAASETELAPVGGAIEETPVVADKQTAHDNERVAVRQETSALSSKRIGDLQERGEAPDLLTADRLLDPNQLVKPEPEGAWRHLVYSMSGKRINLGDSKRARERKALDARIAAPITGGSRFVPVLSRKGGVGKTTVTTLLGMALADARDDRIVAVDANPDRGTLAQRVSRSTQKTVRDLVRVRDEIRGYNDLSAIVARDATRLDVLASDTDPRISEAFNDEDYRHVADVTSRYYSIVLTDCGTGIVHSVMGATLDFADRIVIVAGLSVDEARLASETLTWLEMNGYGELARDAVVVLNQTSSGAPVVRLNELEAHFKTRVRDVIRVPYDPMIASGSAISFRELQPETRNAARELAALVVAGLRETTAVA